MSVSGCSMWLPMWVFDGNGFTMACLAVWIRNVALRWGLPQWRGGQERWMRRHPTAPVNVARISVATSGTDFTAPEADFAALIRAASRTCPACNGRVEMELAPLAPQPSHEHQRRYWNGGAGQ